MDETKQVKLLETMMEFDRGDPMRIQHFLKVWGFARQIGKMEELDEQTQEILETAAIVHDIGIKVCLEKYGNWHRKASGGRGAGTGGENADGAWLRRRIDFPCKLPGRSSSYLYECERNRLSDSSGRRISW